MIGGAFSGEIAPLARGGGADDFVALAEYNGELYTWHNGAVVRYGVSASGRTESWSASVASSATGAGATAAPARHARRDRPGAVGLRRARLRAWGRNSDGNHDYAWPLPTASYFDNADLLVFGGATNVHALQLRPRRAAPASPPAASDDRALARRLLDGDKAWSRIGAEFALPGAVPPSACTVTLAYRPMARDFTTAGSASVSSAAPRTLAFLPATPSARADAALHPRRCHHRRAHARRAGPSIARSNRAHGGAPGSSTFLPPHALARRRT
ncbi:MAG: hypothetical protein U0232_01675 [Thermomicrobiales bacterium]